MPVRVGLSAAAKSGLVQIAAAHDYISPDARINRGLNKVFELLASYQLNTWQYTTTDTQSTTPNTYVIVPDDDAYILRQYARAHNIKLWQLLEAIGTGRLQSKDKLWSEYTQKQPTTNTPLPHASTPLPDKQVTEAIQEAKEARAKAKHLTRQAEQLRALGAPNNHLEFEARMSVLAADLADGVAAWAKTESARLHTEEMHRRATQTDNANATPSPAMATP
jgi:hypothetical protein